MPELIALASTRAAEPPKTSRDFYAWAKNMERLLQETRASIPERKTRKLTQEHYGKVPFTNSRAIIPINKAAFLSSNPNKNERDGEDVRTSL